MKSSCQCNFKAKAFNLGVYSYFSRPNDFWLQSMTYYNPYLNWIHYFLFDANISRVSELWVTWTSWENAQQLPYVVPLLESGCGCVCARMCAWVCVWVCTFVWVAYACQHSTWLFTGVRREAPSCHSPTATWHLPLATFYLPLATRNDLCTFSLILVAKNMLCI